MKTRRALSILLALAFWTFAINVSPASAQVAGEWRQTTLEAIQSTSERCISIWLGERRLVLNPMPDGSLAGVYARSDWGQWLFRQDPACQLPGTAYATQQSFQRLRTWTVLAAPVGPNRWKIGSRFEACSFMGCDQPGLSSAPFEVTVELRGTRLIEVAGDGELHSYRPMAEVTSVSDAAEASFRAALADFDAGNCVRFYSQNFLRGSIDMRAASALCQSTESLRRGLPQITSTDFIHRSALDAVLTNGRYQQVDDVILLGFGTHSDGTTFPRGAILHRDNGRWLIRRMLTAY